MSLNDLTILVTGSNRGIGLEFINQLLNRHSPKLLFAACRDPSKATDLQKLQQKHKNLRLLQMDVVDDKQIEAAVKTVAAEVGDNGLNLLINNAGVMGLPPTPFGKITRQKLMESYDINAVGPFMVTQAFAWLLKQAAANKGSAPIGAQKACVVNMSTGFASIQRNNSSGMGSFYEYRGAKTGQNQLTRTLSLDLIKSNVLCVAIHPGMVATELTGGRGMTPQESVSGMLNVICSFNQKHNGEFYGFDGKQMEW